MTYRIIIEPTAEKEIRSAVRWKAENASRAMAARWYNGLIRKIDTLRRHPTRCPIATEDEKFPEEIRELIYGKGGKRVHRHRIIFTIREDAVHILYVRHTARDELNPQ
jgi:plasmid stabilization system protein ParE